jgi:hypothetical protein
MTESTGGGLGDLVGKAKEFLTEENINEAVDKVKDFATDERIDQVVDKVKDVAPDSIDGFVDQAAEKAKGLND